MILNIVSIFIKIWIGAFTISLNSIFTAHFTIVFIERVVSATTTTATATPILLEIWQYMALGGVLAALINLLVSRDCKQQPPPYFRTRTNTHVHVGAIWELSPYNKLSVLVNLVAFNYILRIAVGCIYEKIVLH